MNELRPSWVQHWWPEWGPSILTQNLLIEDRVLQTSHLHQNLAHLQAFSPAKIYLHTIHLRDEGGDIVGVFHGRHTSLFAGIPPTHRHIQLPIHLTFCIQNLSITRVSLAYEAHTLLQQLGLVPKGGK
jgi:hypothetical protein